MLPFTVKNVVLVRSLNPEQTRTTMPEAASGSSMNKYGAYETRAPSRRWVPKFLTPDHRAYSWSVKREPDKAANRENERNQGAKPKERGEIFGSSIGNYWKRIPDFFSKRKKLDEVLMGFGVEEVEKFLEATRQGDIRASALDKCFRERTTASMKPPKKRRTGKSHTVC